MWAKPAAIRVESRGGTFAVYDSGDSGAVDQQIIILLHGLGATSQSFNRFVSSFPPGNAIRAIAFDARGHGHTKFDESNEDLSLDMLVNDAIGIISTIILPDKKFILCGHSMGGAIAVHVANDAEIRDRCSGLIVIEAVEGLAMQQALSSPEAIPKRPERFRTIQDALTWSCSPQGPLPHASFSAEVSIPDQLVASNEGYTWRTDVPATFPYWREWFSGLSTLFLTCPIRCKALVVSNVDKLDAELTVGQMQGKFQLLLLQDNGHFLHEIAPGQTATVVCKFILQHIANRPATATATRGMSAAEILALKAKAHSTASPHRF